MESRPMQISSVLSRALQTWFDHFAGFFVLALLLSFPVIPLEMAPAVAGGNEGVVGILAQSSGLVQFVARLVLTGVVVTAVFQSLRGESEPLTESISSVMPKLPSIIGASIIVPIVVGLGFMACIVPGVYLSLMLAVVIPVIIVEDQGIIDAFGRSKELTEDQKGSIFGIYFIYFIIACVMSFIALGITMVAFGIGFAGPAELAQSGEASTGTVFIATLIGHVANAVVMPLQATVTTVIYHDLRQIHEGLNIDQMFPTPGEAGGAVDHGNPQTATDAPDAGTSTGPSASESTDQPAGADGFSESPDPAEGIGDDPAGPEDDIWGESDDDGPAW